MNRKTFSQSLRTARTEFVKWICSPRMLIAGILVLVIHTLAVLPLLERAEKMGQSMNVFEPMIAVGNSGVLVLLMPAVFLILMSDYPMIEQNSLMYLSRIGRLAWFRGQLLFSLMSIAAYIGGIFVLVGALSAGGSVFGTEWSESTRKYAFRFPEDANGFTAELLPPHLYNQIPLGMTLLYTFSLLVLYFFTLTLILMLFAMLKKRRAGLLCCFAAVMGGVATCAVKTDAMWLFPMSNTIIWLHYTEIQREPIYPIWCSYLYFGVCIAALLLACRLLLKRMEFDCGEVIQ